MSELPSPTEPVASRREVFLAYLDFFRTAVIERVESIPEAEARASRLATGWSPLELLKHLRFVEMRWLEWGFEGRSVEAPWGDHRDGRWFLAEDETRDSLVNSLEEQGAHTRRIVRAHDLAALGRPGPRWEGAPPPTLERILFHLLQEYARHLGHLDVVVELAGGPVGE